MLNKSKEIISLIFKFLLKTLTLIVKCVMQLICKTVETVWPIILSNVLVFLGVTVAFLYIILSPTSNDLEWNFSTVLEMLILYIIVLWCSIAMSQSNEQSTEEQITKENINIKQTNISLFSWFKNINKK